MNSYRFIKKIGIPVTEQSKVSFLCQHCGECCKNRAGAPVQLTGYDIFRLAKFMKKENPFQLIQEGVLCLGRAQYSLPYVTVSTDTNGACIFLNNTKCSVHTVKPAVCALYPLGRIFNSSSREYLYVFPRNNACSGSGKSNPVPAEQWLRNAKITQDEKNHAVSESAYAEILSALRQIKHRFHDDLFPYIIWAFYMNFDPQQNYAQQLEENMAILRPLLEEAKNKR